MEKKDTEYTLSPYKFILKAGKKIGKTLYDYNLSIVILAAQETLKSPKNKFLASSLSQAHILAQELSEAAIQEQHSSDNNRKVSKKEK